MSRPRSPQPPSPELTRLGRRYRQLRDDLDKLHPQLVEAIRSDSRAGVAQVVIVEATGYTREMIRRITRREAS